MSSTCHQFDLLFGPISANDLEIDCRSDESPTLSSRGLPARAHSNGVCVGALFALKHRNERLATAIASPSGEQNFVVKGQPFGGGGSGSGGSEDRGARPEAGKPRKVPVQAFFNFNRALLQEPPMARGLAPPLTVRQAHGLTKGQEVLQQARARNSQPRREAGKKERAAS